MNSKTRILLPLLIAVAFVAGLYVNNEGIKNIAASGQQSNNKLNALFELIENNYADSISQDDLVEELIPIILEKLDPHSSYIVPEDYRDFQDPIRGNFEGVGIQFNVKKDTIVAIQIIPGGPSQIVGLQAGDRIVTVNDSVVAGIGITTNQVVKLLKGPKGTKVTVGIVRGGSPEIKEFVITRNKIPLYSIDVSYILKDDIGYMKISSFSMSTPDEFLKHIKKLRQQGMKKLVLDLRENGGGVLGSSIFLADEFLQKDELIVYTEGKAFERNNEFATGYGSCKDIELAVLLNEFSASASEVFAGAIQDNDRGVIIGRRSFGKGFVNKDFMFYDSSTVRLTIQKFYSPSGRCIQKPYDKGVEAYNNELQTRLLHGELEEKDSISFPDSLIFKTKSGRTVYGGGGIMPEIFVPLDTIGITDYFSDLVSRGLVYDFAFSYADSHRKELSALKNLEERVQYLDKNNTANSLIKFAENKGVEFNQEEFSISETLIKAQLYAYILRTVSGDDEFYPIINKDDSTIKAALNYFE